MKHVPYTSATFADGFFAPRQTINRNVTIPAQLEILKKTGRIDAFTHAGQWDPKDFFTSHRFWDSDTAKWLEAAAYSLGTHPDMRLDQAVDDIIAKLARAQMPDGYLNSHYQSQFPHKRWTNLTHDHELYCAGHLLEAAVAHHQATGKTNLLNVLRRYVDHIEKQFRHTSSHARASDGHEEIELALMRLYKLDGDPRHLALAQHFVDVRGQGRSVLGHNPLHADKHFYDEESRRRGEDPRKYWFKSYEYLQAHKPVREHDQIVGHAVRATYLYAAVADLALVQQDAELRAVCERVWNHLVSKRMYVTGGVGVSAANEGFTDDHDLPDHGAYAETCASIGIVFWAQRMLALTGEARYADEMERMLYNNIPAGRSADGTQYFYENPLASNGNHHRQDWFDCACCPPNLARLFASLSGYAYSFDDANTWIHLLAAGRCDMGPIQFALQGEYPWKGRLTLNVTQATELEHTIRVRIPSWCKQYRVRVNKSSLPAAKRVVDKGYLCVTRRWQPGDTISIDLEMPVERVYAHPNVRNAAGRVALMRGPVVYCFEGCDHAGLRLEQLRLPAEAAFNLRQTGGTVQLLSEGWLNDASDWDEQLYRTTPNTLRKVQIAAVPYAMWDNRQPGEMRVWIHEA